MDYSLATLIVQYESLVKNCDINDSINNYENIENQLDNINDEKYYIVVLLITHLIEKFYEYKLEYEESISDISDNNEEIKPFYRRHKKSYSSISSSSNVSYDSSDSSTSSTDDDNDSNLYKKIFYKYDSIFENYAEILLEKLKKIKIFHVTETIKLFFNTNKLGFIEHDKLPKLVDEDDCTIGMSLISEIYLKYKNLNTSLEMINLLYVKFYDYVCSSIQENTNIHIILKNAIDIYILNCS